MVEGILKINLVLFARDGAHAAAVLLAGELTCPLRAVVHGAAEGTHEGFAVADERAVGVADVRVKGAYPKTRVNAGPRFTHALVQFLPAQLAEASVVSATAVEAK